MSSAAQRRLCQVFGPAALDVVQRLQTGARSLLHVVLVHEDARGRYRMVRITPTSPKNPTDRFVLHVCRASADVVITTAENVRREPMLTSSFDPELLAAFRPRHAPPLATLILSRTASIPGDHPLLTNDTQMFYTGPVDNAMVAALPIEVVVARRADLFGAIQYLFERQCHVISVEAGWSTSSRLYQQQVDHVDLLFITVFRGDVLESDLGQHCVELQPEQIQQRFHIVGESREDPWSFQLLARRQSLSS